MTYHWDRYETNPIHDAEREESRHARQFATTCYRHDYRPDGRGGGVCQCGDAIGREEL